MFKIIRKQMDALARAQSQDFRRRLELHLRSFENPVCRLDFNEFKQFLDRSLDLAASFNFSTEYEICQFAEIAAHVGPAALTVQGTWMTSILIDTTLNAQSKLTSVAERLPVEFYIERTAREPRK